MVRVKFPLLWNFDTNINCFLLWNLRKKWKFTFCPSTIPIIWHIVVQTSKFLKIRCKEKWTKFSCYPNAIWASYSVRNILISWEIESYPRKSFEKLENSQNWMNKTSFSFWDHVNSGLSKTCFKTCVNMRRSRLYRQLWGYICFKFLKTRAHH